jgi:hypothetical protein
MSTSTGDNTKTRKARPKTTGELIGVRLQPEILAALDEAIADDAAENPPAFTRPGLIRTIVEDWLISQSYLPDRPSNK